ncbi:HepT-like ribonuclease domain-containing protein [Lactococcus sp. NH2-7C]|uniref:HepT-like ribonuclease domain-containing protein n=2 Tax=Streptococcaceae TaxID=1300 RepID=UPI001CDBE32D|nr:HepT-like ribonuclease domain-containing protein [Lactococcus sp. NH2-7C]MCA2390550.1 DUF86 domain-containing protein [Lactococcus sp. NH2-7C]
MRKDSRYIRNMIEFGERALETFAKVNDNVEKLEENYDLYNSVLMSLVQLGENVNLVGEEIKEKYQGINWNKHRRNRNRNFYVHVYGAVNIRRLGEYLHKDVPELVENLKMIERKVR